MRTTVSSESLIISRITVYRKSVKLILKMPIQICTVCFRLKSESLIFRIIPACCLFIVVDRIITCRSLIIQVVSRISHCECGQQSLSDASTIFLFIPSSAIWPCYSSLLERLTIKTRNCNHIWMISISPASIPGSTIWICHTIDSICPVICSTLFGSSCKFTFLVCII